MARRDYSSLDLVLGFCWEEITHPWETKWWEEILPSTLLRVDGYCKWMIIPSGWLLQVDGYSEWMVIANGLVMPSGWLLQVDGYSE